MRVILLERIEKLGKIGDIVSVKRGFARNFLLPRKKALRSTIANLEYLESKKVELEDNNLRLKEQAEKIALKMADVSLVIIRQASESGMLFGSVRTGDISSSLSEAGFIVDRKQIEIVNAIKTVGNHSVKIILHPEVSVGIAVRVMTAQEQDTARVEQDQEVVSEEQ
jgi:large subunit ribosomal protein L9